MARRAWMVVFFVLGIALGSAGSASAQCALDRNRDGRTTVDELVFAVSESLNGCVGTVATPTRTPTQPPVRTPTSAAACPFDFNTNNIGPSDRGCVYRGTVRIGCSSAGVPSLATWASNGSDVIAVFVDSSGSVGALATRTSRTSAQVVAIANGPDYETFVPATGSLSLPTSTRFSGSMELGLFDCTDVQFEGTFSEVTGGAAAGAAAIGAADSSEENEASEVLRRLAAAVTP